MAKQTPKKRPDTYPAAPTLPTARRLWFMARNQRIQENYKPTETKKASK